MKAVCLEKERLANATATRFSSLIQRSRSKDWTRSRFHILWPGLLSRISSTLMNPCVKLRQTDMCLNLCWLVSIENTFSSHSSLRKHTPYTWHYKSLHNVLSGEMLDELVVRDTITSWCRLQSILLWMSHCWSVSCIKTLHPPVKHVSYEGSCVCVWFIYILSWRTCHQIYLLKLSDLTRSCTVYVIDWVTSSLFTYPKDFGSRGQICFHSG